MEKITACVACDAQFGEQQHGCLAFDSLFDQGDDFSRIEWHIRDSEPWNCGGHAIKAEHNTTCCLTILLILFGKDFRSTSDFIEYKQVTCQRKENCGDLENTSLS